MRIAFVGLPLAALLLHHDGHEIVWAGVCRKDALGTRRLRRALGKERVAIVPDLGKQVSRVADLAPELLVSWFWTKKVPPAFLAVAPRSVGVHPSLLPRHRGPDPYFWAIDAGDATTGVTAHELEAEYDTGAMLGQRTLAIDPSWSAWRLAKKLDRPSLALLRETVRAFASGSPPARTTQDEALATDAPQPSDDDLELRWTGDAEAIVRRVRAASPWPGAFTAIHDTDVIVTEARVADEDPRTLAALEPGEAFLGRSGLAVVRAGTGAVTLLAGRLEEDDGDRPLDAGDLAAIVDVAGGGT